MAWWNNLLSGFNTTGENKEPEVEPLIERLKKIKTSKNYIKIHR